MMLRAGLWVGAVLLVLVGVGVWAAIKGLETPEVSTQAVDVSTLSAAHVANRTGMMRQAVVPNEPQERAAIDTAHWEEWADDDASEAEHGRAQGAVWQGYEVDHSSQERGESAGGLGGPGVILAD